MHCRTSCSASRRSKYGAVKCILAAIVGFSGLFLPTRIIAQESSAKQKAKDVVGQFLKALQAKDVEQMLKFADVPWLAENQQVVKDAKELRKLWRGRLEKPKASKEEFNVVNALPYSQVKGWIKEEPSRKLLDQIMGEKGWVAYINIKNPPFSARYVLVRERAGNTKVIGGPFKYTYLLRPNNIPGPVKELLEKVQEFELFSLDPKPPLQNGKDRFHGWKVLGKTRVKNANTRKTLLAAFKQAVAENEGFANNCFDPRHGIRMTRQGKTWDLVICFKCFQVQVFGGTQGKGEFLITRSAQPAFDEVLRAAGIPRAPAK